MRSYIVISSILNNSMDNGQTDLISVHECLEEAEIEYNVRLNEKDPYESADSVSNRGKWDTVSICGIIVSTDYEPLTKLQWEELSC